MLDDLAVLQPEDIDDGHAALAGFAHAMHVQDHVVALGEGALDLALGARELLLAQSDEALQALDAVGRTGIVLDIVRSEIFRCRVEVLLPNVQIDELGNGRFARSLFDRSCACRAVRVVRLGESATAADLTTLTAEDVRGAYADLTV